MIDPYMAVALQTNVHHVTSRAETKKNLTHIGNMIDLVVHMCSMELPVKLIALSEGVIQGFVDEIMDMNQAEYTRTMAADIPGWETDMLGEKALSLPIIRFCNIDDASRPEWARIRLRQNFLLVG